MTYRSRSASVARKERSPAAKFRTRLGVFAGGLALALIGYVKISDFPAGFIEKTYGQRVFPAGAMAAGFLVALLTLVPDNVVDRLMHWRGPAEKPGADTRHR